MQLTTPSSENLIQITEISKLESEELEKLNSYQELVKDAEIALKNSTDLKVLESLIAQIQDSFSKLSINNQNLYLSSLNILKNRVQELSEIKNSIQNHAEELKQATSVDDINTLQQEAKEVQNLIAFVDNEPLKEKFISDYQNTLKILNDITPPVIEGITDQEIAIQPVNISILDETITNVLLNDEPFDPNQSISDNGDYILEVADQAFNKTIITFQVNIPSNELVSELDSSLDFTLPLKKGYITQNYKGSLHMGVDFSSDDKSEKIYPIAQGEVIYVGTDNYGANIVKIKHEINNQIIYSTYGHMKEVYFQEGQIVSNQDLLGIMGSTGKSSGEHLHLEMSTCDYTENCDYSTYKMNILDPFEFIPYKPKW